MNDGALSSKLYGITRNVVQTVNIIPTKEYKFVKIYK